MCPTATSPTTNRTWTDPDSKPGRRGIRLRPKCKQYEINSLPSVSRQQHELRFFFFAGSQELPPVLIRIVMDSTDKMITTRKYQSTLSKNLC